MKKEVWLVNSGNENIEEDSASENQTLFNKVQTEG
jgi:hypothetical protein